jgi:DHA1 family arabinose polymer transporter-like MFS transporter
MIKKILPLTLGGLGIGITEFVMMGLLPDIATDLSISIPQAGNLISAYALGVVVGAPLLAIYTSKLPPKKTLIGLMILFCVFNAISAFSPNFYFLLAGRFFSGLPHGAFFGVGSVVASKIAEKGKESQAVSLMFAGLTIANIIGVPLGTYIGHNYSWRISFALVVLVGLITLLSIHFKLPALKANENSNIKNEMSFFKQANAWIIVAMISIGTGGLFAWYSYIAPLNTEVTGIASNNISYILILTGLGMMIGNYIGGILADKLKPAKASLYALIAMAITLIIVHFTAHNLYLSIFFTFITGIMSFVLVSPIQMLMINTAKGSEMLAASASQASFNVGNALGAYFGGLPILLGLNYTYPAVVGAAMAIIGCFFAFWFIKRNPNL